jgi:drug/metabolite transporter (DMT)-like permease
MSSGKRPPAWRADLALAAIAFIWGATFILVKEALADMPVLLFLAVRFSFGAVLLAAIVGFSQGRSGLRRSVLGGVVAGTLLFGGYALQTFGLRLTSASKAGFLTGLYIPLVPIFGAMIYRRTPHLSEGVGVALAFAGTALMSIQGDLLSVGRGDALVAGCAVVYALHIVVLGHFAKIADVGWLAVMQIATAAVWGWITCWAEPVRAHWSATLWTALAVTSVFATAFAFVTQTWAQKYTTATRTALVFSLEPVFAWLASYVAAGELLTGRALAGAALILAGILVAELKPLRWRAHQQLSDEARPS